MTMHSVADAKNNLSQLIDRALEGETVVITRHGRNVVRLVPEIPVAKTVSREGLAWLAERRIKGAFSRDAGDLVSQMRDEECR